MYLAIDIQMLILVVKLYVFSDYILRKRVPKSKITTKAIMSLLISEHWPFFLEFHWIKATNRYPFWSPWKNCENCEVCAEKHYLCFNLLRIGLSYILV